MTMDFQKWSFTSKAGPAIIAMALIGLANGQLLAQEVNSSSDQTARPWISVSGASYHLERASQFNQNNPGVGIEWPIQAPWSYDTRLAVGGFKNSESARSLYAGAFIFPFSSASGQFKAGALLGMIDGYKGANSGGFFPLAVPTIAYEAEHFGANLFLIPPVSTIPPTLALQFKLRF
jgi:hypothetical protein